MSHHAQVLIIGGGTAGLTTAALLRNQPNPPGVTIVEPKTKHYYQPLWTLVGAGVFPKEETEREEADFIPDGAEWIREAVATFEPEANAVVLANGDRVTYDALVVATGIQLDYDKVDGLVDTLGANGVCSNYRYDLVEYTWECIQGLQGGNAVFTFPATPIKCAGAPQKIMWLTEHALEKAGKRDKVDIHYGSATAGIFGIPRYAKTLNKLVEKRHIIPHYQHDLVAVDGPGHKATFQHIETGAQLVLDFAMLHVTPPQSAPEVIKSSPLANEAGWVDVHKHTTQHVRYPNVFSLGDSSGLPNSKTAAAVRKQGPVTATNLRAFLDGRPLTASYNGYASCPLVTGYGRLILAEFGYDGEIMETMPFDQSQERYSMYATKAYALPRMYWHGMLRGRW